MQNELTYGKYRLEALADGIFGFAMTLLVINLHVPAIALIHSEAMLMKALTIQWPVLISYVLSFLLLGVAWTGHQAQFGRVTQTNHTQNWLHIAYLMTIAAIPFSTGLLGQFSSYRTAHFIYGLNLILGSTFMLLLWWHADRNHLIVTTGQASQTFIAERYKRLLATILIYGLAMLAAFISTSLSYMIYLLIPISLIVSAPVLRRTKPSE